MWIIIAGNQRCFSTAGTFSFWCWSVTLSRQTVGHRRGRILGFVFFSSNSLLATVQNRVLGWLDLWPDPICWVLHPKDTWVQVLGPTYGNRNLQGFFSTAWALRKTTSLALTDYHASTFYFFIIKPPNINSKLIHDTAPFYSALLLHVVTTIPSYNGKKNNYSKKKFNSLQYSCTSGFYHLIGDKVKWWWSHSYALPSSYHILVKRKAVCFIISMTILFLVVHKRLMLFWWQWWYFHIVNNTLY